MRPAWSMLLALALLLAGCTAAPAPVRQAQPTEADRAQVLAAVLGYMEHRRDDNLAGAYEFLSQATRQLYSRDEFVKYYSSFPRMEWQRVGAVTFVAGDWARVVVYDISILRKGGDRVVLADFPYYVHKQGGNWGVALINPRLPAFEATADLQQAVSLSQSLLKVHPYSMNVHTRLFDVYLSIGAVEKAHEQLKMLYRVSGPSDLAAWQTMRAEFFLQSQGATQAIKALQQSLKLAEKYPERYDARWRSQVWTTLARAYDRTGALPEVKPALVKALQEDPANAEARQLLESLEQTKT